MAKFKIEKLPYPVIITEVKRKDGCLVNSLLRKGTEESCRLCIVTTIINKFRLLNGTCCRHCRTGHDQEDREEKTLHHSSTFQQHREPERVTLRYYKTIKPLRPLPPPPRRHRLRVGPQPTLRLTRLRVKAR